MSGSRSSRVVEAVVGGGEALVVAHHQRRPMLVILAPRRLQRRVRLPPGGEWERLEAVARRSSADVSSSVDEKKRAQVS